MPEWLPSRLQNRWSEACGSGRIRINQQTPSGVGASFPRSEPRGKSAATGLLVNDSGIIRRRIEPVLRSFLRTFRVTALLGPRQSGKTTLARQVTNGGILLSLDNPDTLQAALDDPVGFVRDRPRPVVIDEVQRGGDDLVRAVKLVVDQDRSPGSFLLTGSTNLLTVPDLSESLAGRMGIVELAPFSEAEALGRDSPGLMAWLLDHAARGGEAARYEELLARAHSQVSRRQYTQRICAGGYPEAQRLGEVERGGGGGVPGFAAHHDCGA